MRRFMVHLVTEIDFQDGDERQTGPCRTTRSVSRRLFRTRPKGSRSGRSRAPGSRVSRSQKSKLNSGNPATSGLNHGLGKTARSSATCSWSSTIASATWLRCHGSSPTRWPQSSDAGWTAAWRAWECPAPPQFGGQPVANIRNVSSPHWRAWLTRAPGTFERAGALV